MFLVQLTDSELAVCQMIGNMRHIACRSNFVTDTQVGKQGKFDIDQDGVIGEYAFCKYHNIFMSVDLSIRSGSFDCMIRGKRIDVKTTRVKNGRLIKTLKENQDVDIYVLAILDGNTVTFPGWIEKENFTKPENISDLGHGKTYVLTQDQLKSWEKTNG